MYLCRRGRWLRGLLRLLNLSLQPLVCNFLHYLLSHHWLFCLCHHINPRWLLIDNVVVVLWIWSKIAELGCYLHRDRSLLLPFVRRYHFCNFLGRRIGNKEIVDIVVIDDVRHLLRLLGLLRANKRNLSRLVLIIVLKDFVIIKSFAHHFSTRYWFLLSLRLWRRPVDEWVRIILCRCCCRSNIRVVHRSFLNGLLVCELDYFRIEVWRLIVWDLWRVIQELRIFIDRRMKYVCFNLGWRVLSRITFGLSSETFWMRSYILIFMVDTRVNFGYLIGINGYFH